jgi:FkbM family methyltransferase
LRRRIELSRAKMKWTVTNGLVGKRTGTARLNYAHEDNQNFVDESAQRDLWARAGGAEDISYVDLAALVNDAPSIDLIKCDIEGSEFDFIQSYPDLLRKTVRLVIEFHSAFGGVAEAVDRLKVAGFGRPVVLREDAKTPVIYLSRV